MKKYLFNNRSRSKDKESPITEMMRNQLTSLTIIFRTLAVFIVALTIFLGIFSILRIDKIEDKLTLALDRQDRKAIDLSESLQQRIKEMREELIQREQNMGNKIDRQSDRLNDDVKIGITDMEEKFDKLSGQALLKPEIEIIYANTPVNGKIINFKAGNAGDNPISLEQLLLWNKGSKPVQDFTIIFFFSKEVSTMQNRYPLIKDGYKVGYSMNYSSQVISPGYKWSPEYSDFNFRFSSKEKSIEIKCLVEVYYNNPEPSTAEFTIKISK